MLLLYLNLLVDLRWLQDVCKPLVYLKGKLIKKTLVHLKGDVIRETAGVFYMS